ncbi:ABC transporter ATP-binding protein [Rickettsiales bacterium]|nr:ABC transporter ATP-binding protein [Rickettsiales bacterium]
MNSYLELKDATFIANKAKIIKNVSFNIDKKGEIICLLGPSGVGKTTILRTIAGLNDLHDGQIILNKKIISTSNYKLEPQKRNIAMSFQENSLFPHKTVEQNLNLGLERKTPKKFIYTTKELIKIFHLSGLENKYPHEISSGEAQRVSLARSLISNPDLLLLDEPFSNIDQILKDELQIKIKEIIKKSAISTIIVTHDSYEAFYLGDKCGIIIGDSLKQFDIPYNIYHYPKSIDVVNFLKRGILVTAKIINNNELTHKNLGIIKGNFVKKQKVGKNVKLLIQPDDLEHDDRSRLKLEIVDRKFRGTNFIYTLRTQQNELIPVFVHSHHHHQHKIGEKFGIKLPIRINHLVCF